MFSRELEDVLDKAMAIYDGQDKDNKDESRLAWTKLWDEQEQRLKELEGHARALHISPK